MRLTVRHSTLYQFDVPMRFVTQSHRLTPASNEGQAVRDWSVSADGATFGASFVDGAGDAITTLTMPGPVDRIAILVEGSVETTDSAGVLRGHRETVWPQIYRQPTAATAPARQILELRDAALEGAADAGALDLAHLLSAAVADNVAYEPGTTGAQTTAAEALKLGRGVCQDHAHLLIALAHAADMPARYVTGYLLIGDGEEVGEAAHAWAEIHVPGLGWVGFDPANRCCPDERYIRLGSGRDAREAAPIRGISRGGGVEAMDVTVTVVAAQQ